MALKFKVIVPLDAWEWEEGKSTIYLRFFSTHELGKWGRDIGPGIMERYFASIIIIHLKFPGKWMKIFVYSILLFLLTLTS